MNFYTLFTKTENVHLLKDIGMIPESLAKCYPDIESYIVTYRNGEYPYIGKEIQNTKLLFIKKQFGKCLDGIHFIRNNNKNIDVLNIYHLNLSSFLYCIAAKIYLKKEAIIYLKLDVGPMEMKKLRKHDLRAVIKRWTIRLADVVTGETSILVNMLQQEVDSKIKLIPNGYYAPGACIAVPEQKKNRIITVGRLGAEEKNTELLINAFISSMDEHNWELRLIGPYTRELYEYVDMLYCKYPNLKNRLVLRGEITEQNELQKEYAESKVFALPSKWEGFALVLPSALRCGNYIITSSHVPAAHDIIYSDDAGIIVESDDVHIWSKLLAEITKKEIDWKKMCKNGLQIAESKFKWERIAEQIYNLLSSHY